MQTSSCIGSQVGQNTLNCDKKGWIDLWLLHQKKSPTICLLLHSQIESQYKFGAVFKETGMHRLDDKYQLEVHYSTTE